MEEESAITDCYTTGASANGGAVYCYAGTFNMKGGTISAKGLLQTNTNAAPNGGAVYVTFRTDKTVIPNKYVPGAFHMTGGTIEDVSASTYGGAVYVSTRGSSMTMTGGTIRSSKAPYGGAISVNWTNAGGTGLVTLSGGTIEETEADKDGGAVYIMGGDALTLSGVTIRGTRAGFAGGAIHSKGNVTMTDGTIENTQATNNGGAIYLEYNDPNKKKGGTLTMSGGTISGASANFGGAVNVQPGCSMTMSDGIINRASAYIGGAVYNLGTLTMEGGSMQYCYSNYAARQTPNGAGAVYNEGSFEMKGGLLDHCETDCLGGGVFQKAGELILSGNAQIDECKSNYGGGGVCIAGGSFTMKDDASIQHCGVSGNDNQSSTNYHYQCGGGGVSVLSNGKFTMDSGRINLNHTFQSDGAGLLNEGTVFMNGGQINNNSAYDGVNGESWSGGGVYTVGAFTMKGGEIADNIGVAGLYYDFSSTCKTNSSLTITGGAIYGNYAPGKTGLDSFEYTRTTDLAIDNANAHYSVIPALQMKAEGQDFQCWRLLYDTQAQTLGIESTLPVPDGSYTPSSNSTSYYHAETKSEVKILEGVYLDPQNGDDAQTGGNALDPVKSWDKALELARACLAAKPNETVDLFLCSTLTLTGQQTLEMPEDLKGRVVVKRARPNGSFDGNMGYLIQVPGSGDALTLKNITLDGNLKHGFVTGSLVYVGRGASLTIEDGAELRNNLSGASVTKENGQDIFHPGREIFDYRGGAVYINGGECTMTGGKITQNESYYLGAGVSVNGGKFTLKGGEITENHAAYGGGLSAIRGSTIHLLGGSIVQNGAEHQGGGLHIGGPNSAEAIPQNTLLMEGGLIDGNHATVGGGIFIQMNSVATISQGDITQNRTTLARTGHPYRGGGIYVNGGKNALIAGTGTSGIEDGILQLYDVEITRNDSPHVGGGFAMCPTGYMKLYISRGGAIYDNTTQTADGKDIFVNEDLTGEATYVSDVMLGNGTNVWMHDGQPADKTYYQDTRNRVYLTNEPSEEDKAKAHAAAKVHITDNRTASSMGGGIASNGHIVIGDNIALIDIPVQKVWEHGTNPQASQPMQITVRLYQVETDPADPSNSIEIELRSLTLDVSNAWKGIFKALDPQKQYTVKEDPVPDYDVVLTGDQLTGFTLTNTYHPLMDIPVQKVWEHGTNPQAKWPAQITVRLYEMKPDPVDPSISIGTELQHLTLDASNSWKGTFEGLDALKQYTVKEDPVPEYDTALTGDQLTEFVFTNTYHPPLIDIPVRKVWEHDTNPQAKWPAQITVRLYQVENTGNIELQHLTLDASNSWQGTFTWLDPQKQYTVTEDPVSGYTTSITGDQTGFVITNTFYLRLNIPVEKRWDHGENPQANQPAEITARLYEITPNGNVECQQMILNAANAWKGVFTFLDPQKRYAIEEDPIPLYATSITGDQATGFVITNTYNPTLIHIPVEKRWNHGINPQINQPSEITARLYEVTPNGNVQRQQMTLNAANAWKGVFKFLDSQKKYTVMEDPIPGYDVSITGDQAAGFVITNTCNPSPIQIPVEKRWDHGTEEKSLWPTKVTVHLLCDGQVCGTLELSAENNWHGVFTGLLPWHNYSIQEDPVPCYVPTIVGNEQVGFVITNTYSPLPETGDSSAIGLWLLMDALTGAILLYLWRRHRRMANG